MNQQGPIDPTLPYGRHTIDKDDIEAVSHVLAGDWLTGGPAVAEFEAALAARVDARYAVACSSGTAALHLAMLAIGVDRDDEVVVPALTFLATANAVRLAGGEVVFADVDPDSGLMTAASCEDAMNQAHKVKAVVTVHLAGQCADHEAIHALAQSEDAYLVEDGCHALGTAYRDSAGEWLQVGSCRHSDMTAFSFHPVKTVAMGEGGAVTTNDAGLYERLMLLRNHGMVRESGHPFRYEMHELAPNYRASDIHCALGLSQLGKLDQFVEARRILVAQYDARMSSLADWLQPVARADGCMPAWHLYPVLLNRDVDRVPLMNALAERGITTQVHYMPVNEQPYYVDRYGDTPLEGARGYAARTLSLPLFPGMSENDVARVCGALKDVLGESQCA